MTTEQQHEELIRILAKAKDQRACTAAVVNFEKFLNANDYLSCWQMVLAYREWLVIREISYPENIYHLAGNIARKYYESGQILRESHYENGKLNGLWVEYDFDGEILETHEYENGELIGYK